MLRKVEVFLHIIESTLWAGYNLALNSHSSMENMYERTLKYLVTNNLADTFHDRCLNIVNDTDGIGWGFHDQLGCIYDEHLR